MFVIRAESPNVSSLRNDIISAESKLRFLPERLVIRALSIVAEL